MKQKTKHFLNTPLVYRLGTRFIGYLPKHISYWCSARIADLSVFLYKTAYNTVSENLKLPFPNYSEKERKTLSREIFRNYAHYLVDYGRYKIMGKDEIIKEIASYQGKENLERVIAMKKGILLLTGHIGNWELGGLFLSSFGLKTNVVTLPDEDLTIHSLREAYRKKFNINTITIGRSPFAAIDILNILSRGEVVAMLIDRYSKKEDGIYCNFFGKKKLFPIGPIKLGKITGAPIILSFVVKEGDKYKGIIEEPIILNKSYDDNISLQRIVNILEKYIIIYANQWYNFQPV